MNAMAELNVPDRTFFEGDNLAILRGINSECVDLIATDPPFNKRRNMAGGPANTPTSGIGPTRTPILPVARPTATCAPCNGNGWTRSRRGAKSPGSGISS